MRYILIFLFCVGCSAVFGQNNIKKTAAVTYTQGVPTWTPAVASSSEISIDTSTGKIYQWHRTTSAWLQLGQGIDVISGSIAPAYTPARNMSIFAINAVDSLYTYRSGAWRHLNAGGGDDWGAQVVEVDATLTGDGTSGDPIAWAGASVAGPLTGSGTSGFPLNILSASLDSTHVKNYGLSVLDLGQHSASTGQVLKWNGTQWAPAADTDAQTLSIDSASISEGRERFTLSISGGNDVIFDVSKADHGVINALDYGVVGDGVTDDVDSLQAAIDAAVGQRLWIPSGTYYISSELTVASNTEIIMAPDAIIDISAWAPAVTAGATRAIAINGFAYASVNITANIAIGNTSITVSSTASFSVGDIVEVVSTEPLHTGYTGRYKGYLTTVDSIVSGTVLRLSTQSYFAIDATVTYAAEVRRYNTKRNIKISGGKIQCGGAGKGQVGIYASFTAGLIIENMEIDGAEVQAVWLSTSFRPMVRNCYITDCTSSTYLGENNGYGVGIARAVYGATVQGCHFRNCRHSVSGGGTTPPVDAVIINNISYDAIGQDYDCHESAIGWKFIGNSSEMGPNATGGFAIRGTDVVLDGNRINGGTITVSNTVAITGSTLGRVTMTNNIIKNTTNAILISNNYLNEISISGGIIENTTLNAIEITGAARNIKVYGVSFVDVPAKCIYAVATTGLTVSGCTFHNCYYGVDVNAGSSNAAISDCVGTCTYTAVRSFQSSNITVSNCVFSGMVNSSGMSFNTVNNVSIMNCQLTMASASFDAIRASNAYNITAIGNKVSGNYAYGFYGSSNSDTITAIGNDFRQAITGQVYTPYATITNVWGNMGQVSDHGDIDVSVGLGPVLTIDTSAITTIKIAANAIDSTKICTGCISVTDLGQHGAATNDFLAFNGTQWAKQTNSDLVAVEGISGTGIAVRTASNTWTTRTITAGTGVSVSNGSGVSGNPTISVDTTVSNNLLPHGTSTYTLRHSGSAWAANSMITNNGTTIGINSAPNASYQFYVKQPSSTSGLYVARNSSTAGVHLFHDGSANVASVGGFNLKLSTENSALINLIPGGGGGQISQIEIAPLNNITAVFGNTSCVNVNATYAPPTNGGDYSSFRIGGAINQHDSLTQRPRGLGIFPTLTSVNAAGFFGIEYRPSNAGGEAETFLFQPIGAAVSNRLAGDLYIGTDTTMSAAKVQVLGDGATSATYSLIVTNSGGTTSTAALVVRDDSRVGVGTNAPAEKLSVAGNVELTTAGNKLKIATGSNASMGTATLVAGTVTVSTTAVATGSTIFLTCNTPGGVQGFLSAPAASITNATSFVINSSNVADTSTVNWLIIN